MNNKYKYIVDMITIIIVYALWIGALLYLTTKFGVFGFIGGILIMPQFKERTNA